MTLVQTPPKKIYIWREMPNYLCFTANTAWSTVQLSYSSKRPNISLETSTDWITWNDYTIWNTITLSSIWDKVYWRNKTQTDLWFSSSDYSCKFVMTWSIAASWDINFLLNKNSTRTITADYCYLDFFRDCTSLTTAPELPATTLTGMNCYASMFNWCTNLTTAPALLPATTLSDSCYTGMFRWCTSLTATPELPATTLAGSCYASMFRWCTNLRTATTLPATTLASSCYMYMFNQCSNLETLPALPATTLAYGVYYQMFSKCYKIKLSTTQTWAYQTPYRIPTTWTWTEASSWNTNMFYQSWWTFTWAPTINITYYTSNTVV